MKARTLIPLVIGLGVGFFAIKMGIDMVQDAKGEGPGDQVEVLISAQPIDVATLITEQMLTSKSVPKTLLPSDAFTERAELVGRVTSMSVAPNVPVAASMLAPPGAQPGIRAKIPPGFRAVSISVTEESAVAGFVMPGARVDLFAGGSDGTSKLILSDIEVGAVGQSLSEAGRDGKTVRITKSVTLFVRPDEVKVLHRHAAAGRRNLRLALRGYGKEHKKEGEPFWSRVLADALAKDVQAPVVIKKQPPPRETNRHIVEVVRGSTMERFVFAETGVHGEYRRVKENASMASHLGVESGDPEDASYTEMLE